MERLNITILHPFVAWIIPLCLRAEHHALDTVPMQVTMAWAAFVTFLYAFDVVSHKLAYGMHREVDLDEEVIVITGGASGLGLLIAEVYGMRGATVAVLDIAEHLENPEARGVTYYKCDVGDKQQVQKVAAEIERDVSDDPQIDRGHSVRLFIFIQRLLICVRYSSASPRFSSTTRPW